MPSPSCSSAISPFFFIEEKNPKLLAIDEGRPGPAIIDDALYACEQRSSFQFGAGATLCDGLVNLEIARDRRTDAVDFRQPFRAGGEDFGQRAESADQRLGDRLGVAARHHAKQHEFEKFVVGQGIGAEQEAVAQPVAVPEMVGQSDRRLGKPAAAALHAGAVSASV